MVDFSQARVTMVDTQVRPSDVTHLPLIEAMLTIPRDEFVPVGARSVAYSGAHLSLGEDRVLFDPRLLAMMINAIEPGRDDMILDIGCGLGYSTAVMAHMAQAVVGLESDPARVEDAQGTLARLGIDNATVTGGKLVDGVPDQAPYDAILISGGAVEQVPAALTDQLREGGRIVAVFVDGEYGVVRIGRIHQDRVIWRDIFHSSAPVLVEFTRPRGFAL